MIKVKDLKPLLPQKAAIRISKRGFPMLYNGSVAFIPDSVGDELVASIIYEVYRFRRKPTRRKQYVKEYFPVPYWQLYLDSDKPFIPKELKYQNLNAPKPSEQNPADVYGEVGAEYFDEEDKR